MEACDQETGSRGGDGVWGPAETPAFCVYLLAMNMNGLTLLETAFFPMSVIGTF